MAERVRKLPATENRWTRSLFLLFSIIKAASDVWCKLPKNAPRAGHHSRMSSLWVLIITRPMTAPMPSPRMKDALRPMRSDTRPAGMAVTALAMKPIISRRPMKVMSESDGQQVEVEQHREGAVDHVHADDVQHVQVGVAAELPRPGRVVAHVVLGGLGTGRRTANNRPCSRLLPSRRPGRQPRRASGAGDGNRTHVACLEGTGSTIELLPAPTQNSRLGDRCTTASPDENLLGFGWRTSASRLRPVDSR